MAQRTRRCTTASDDKQHSLGSNPFPLACFQRGDRDEVRTLDPRLTPSLSFSWSLLCDKPDEMQRRSRVISRGSGGVIGAAQDCPSSSQQERTQPRAGRAAVRWQPPAGHRGKLRNHPDQGVFMSLGWLTFVE